ncbi:DUF2382 domain-containing protein [Klenkia taihuensis]|uniref:Conserved domain-containing protein n=1 Tax=Klenkia taihuensis TaxID=1225127 RepID=A0A1I1R7L7_9ACTN|nr:PRC and DUF2382 domain-containing protein [Klenkia taihuensis]GHE07162.1 photosystem reaction center subunit H [Klenkia taihuensis]SFD30331.1 conserved domain-containing protein [Klenkia taihuensis]
MITEQDITTVIGATAVDSDGDKIGTVSEVYLDDQSGRPEWATVKTGLFGTKETFVPLAQAQLSGEELRFPYDKATVKDAPTIEAEGHLSPAEESELYRYYGIADGTAGDRGTTDATAGTTAPRPGVADDRREGTVGHDTSGPTTDDAMTRSEERLQVGTEAVETGRARLRKHVVTENVTRTVPVSHEEVRIEREPITDANRGDALDGPALSEEEHEVTLHAERPVVAKETVPVERVRLSTETVTDQAQVSEQVAHEEIEQVEGDVRRTDRDR